MQTDLDILLRLVVTVILSGVLGWEREETGKAAGMRTHMLVGISATLFVVLGELFMVRFGTAGDYVRLDPIRIIEAVIAGISFLGAGTIFVSRSKERVKGLTTAASILVTSAVGITVGIERYVLAVGCTLLIFLVLRGLSFFDRPDVQKE